MTVMEQVCDDSVHEVDESDTAPPLELDQLQMTVPVGFEPETWAEQVVCWPTVIEDGEHKTAVEEVADGGEPTTRVNVAFTLRVLDIPSTVIV